MRPSVDPEDLRSDSAGRGVSKCKCQQHKEAPLHRAGARVPWCRRGDSGAELQVRGFLKSGGWLGTQPCLSLAGLPQARCGALLPLICKRVAATPALARRRASVATSDASQSGTHVVFRWPVQHSIGPQPKQMRLLGAMGRDPTTRSGRQSRHLEQGRRVGKGQYEL